MEEYFWESMEEVAAAQSKEEYNQSKVKGTPADENIKKNRGVWHNEELHPVEKEF